MRVSVSVVVRVASSGCGCETTLLTAVFITSVGCFLLLALDSCVLLVAAAGRDADALAFEKRC